MKSFSYVIRDPMGLHARPVGELLDLVRSFDAWALIECRGRSARLSRSIPLMALAIRQGEEVCLSFEGVDEAAAAQAVEAFFRERL